MKSDGRKHLNKFTRKGVRFLGWLATIVIITWLIKSFLFSVYYIPSLSMYPTLRIGDYVLVSKFPYNLRTPEFYPLTDIRFPYASVDGFGQVHRGDIVVFDLPIFPTLWHPSQKDDYIKRVIGLPGDTIAINKGRYYLFHNSTEKRFFHNSSKTALIQIPQKGTRIQLTDSTKLFWRIILIRDGNKISFDSLGNVYMDGNRMKRYQVQQNYYFVKGDNADFSSDSRYWGLVPQKNLIGRAELILWPWPLEWL